MTEVPLREYIERILEERDRAYRDSMSTARAALDAASRALESRLDQMNEFRKQVLEERANYLRRDQFDAQHESIEKRVVAVEKMAATQSGRFWAVGIAVAVTVAILTTIIDKVWK